MKVKMLKTFQDMPGRLYRSGRVEEVADGRAREMIDKGQARAVIEGEPQRQLSVRPARAVRGTGRQPEVKAEGPLALEETGDGHFRIGKAASPSSSPAAPARKPRTSKASAEPKAKKTRTRKAK